MPCVVSNPTTQHERPESREYSGRRCLIGTTWTSMLTPVSDDYIRLIPTDKRWQPAPEGAAAATRYVGASHRPVVQSRQSSWSCTSRTRLPRRGNG